MSGTRRLDYLAPDCRLTLREAVAELRAAEGVGGDAAGQVAPELARDLDAHDAVHVLFGCPTTAAGEVTAHVWTLLGTTTKLADLHRVSRHEDHRGVVARIGHWKLVKTWVRSLPRIAATAFRACRMTRRWPVEEMERYLDRPLVEIRREFGIRLPPRRSAPPGRGGAALRFARSGAG